ncbi:hypothetical protein [Laspinema sp. D2d]|nr:hypothetical protein [Laspinema sp. D2d]
MLIVYQMVLGMSGDRPRGSDRLEGKTGRMRYPSRFQRELSVVLQ